MRAHPVQRNGCGIELAHEVLPDVIDAVLVVPLVHFRDLRLGFFDFREDGDVMVLPDVVQAVQGVRTRRDDGVVAAADGGGVPGCGEVVTDAKDVRGWDADLAVCKGKFSLVIMKGKGWGKGEEGCITLHDGMPGFLDLRGRRPFEGRLVPE